MRTKLINKIKEKAHRNACEKGFHDEPHTDSYYFGLIITELSEMVEAQRKGKYCELDRTKLIHLLLLDNEESFKEEFEAHVKDTFQDEIADTFIRTLDLAGLREIDLKSLEEIYEELLQDENDTLEEMIQSSKNYLNKLSAPEFLTEVVKTTVECSTIKEALQELTEMLTLWAYLHEVPILQHVETKMRYNSLRPKLHGKKY